MAFQFEYVTQLSSIDKSDWSALNTSNFPFARYEFLQALEQSGSVGEGSGWSPNHLIIREDEKLVGAIPGYLKEHSYGEYVFDWSWANAYANHGLDYYPKQLLAIPFTPVTGPRLLLGRNPPNRNLLSELNDFVQGNCQQSGYSGWHLLFTEENMASSLGELGNLRRTDVQFEWLNHGYSSFDDFLQRFRSSKRKQVKRERRRIAEQEIQLVRKSGSDITNEDWEFFYRCYQQTYAKRSGHGGYLNREFFQLIAETMQEQALLVIASYDSTPVASALLFFDQEALYGRYWGTLLELDCLHFETCYYQGIEFAIEQGLKRFNPGTQGQHKLARGFEPTITHSLHWLAQPQFRAAIADYLERERSEIKHYYEQSKSMLPYHRTISD